MRHRKSGRKLNINSSHRKAMFRNMVTSLFKYDRIRTTDTKAKEFLGRLFRKGRVRCSRAFKAFDHDFPSWADGVLIPHGIYDPARNCGHVNLGLSGINILWVLEHL